MMTTLRRMLATALAVLAPIGVLLVDLLLRSTAPDPLPVHWNASGVVDNTASATVFFSTTLAIAVVLAAGALAAVWLAHSPLAGRMLASLLMFGAWMATAVTLGTLLAAHGVDRAQDVGMPWYAVAAIVVVPALIGIGAWALLPGRWQPPQRISAESTSTLAPGERVTWIGHQYSPVMRWGAAVLAVAGAVLLFRQPPIAIPAFVVALAAAMTSELAVRVDDGGVHTLWGPFGWPRPRIPLADITSARVEQIVPMEWGGWGYRISGRGVAAVIRGGPGLVVERTDKPTYAVTVPEAERGADVLNALLARQRADDGDRDAGRRSAPEG